jgi:hypothetical protein
MADHNSELVVEDDSREYVLDVQKTWSTAWQIFKTNLSSLLSITLLFFLPIYIITAFIPYELIFSRYGRPAINAVQLVEVILMMILSLLSVMTISSITEKQALGEDFLFNEAVKKSFSHLGKAFGTSFVTGLIVFGYSLLLIIPGIVKAVQLVFVINIVILRGLHGKAACDYSQRVVKDNGFRIFGFLLVRGLLTYAISFVISLPLWFYRDQAVLQILLYTISAFINTYFPILITLLFLDLEQEADQRESKTDLDQQLSIETA